VSLGQRPIKGVEVGRRCVLGSESKKGGCKMEIGGTTELKVSGEGGVAMD
jgi:hypothetical protein